MINETVSTGLKLNESLPVSVFGESYEGYYHSGIKAMRKVIAEKAGQVTGAFNHKELGDIDVVWGKVTDSKLHKGFGLAHILDKHPNFDLTLIPKIIKKGTIIKTRNGFNIQLGKYVIGINDGYKINGVKNNNNRWIVTSFEKK